MLKTASLILVGDLFLQGKKENKTLHHLINELNLLNYDVKKVSIVHENERLVTYELEMLSKQFDVLIVVGEFNTNIIFKALTNVTCQGCETNLRVNNLQESNQHDYQDICRLPLTARLIMGYNLSYPIVQVQRIFILREQHIEEHLDILRKHLQQYRMEPKYSKVIYLQTNNSMTTLVLEKIKEANVYPFYEENGTTCTIKLESANFENIVECEQMIKKELKNAFIESVIKSNVFNIIYSSPDEHIQQSIEIIEKGLEEYHPENVFISFNGGKDCTVLLHLIYTVMCVKFSNYKSPLLCLYVKSDNAFPEQDKFISQCQIYFNLEVIIVSSGIKDALSEILLKKPNLKACFMGTRRTDPFSSDLESFQMTDSDWPQIMRVSPLLEWHYSDIWNYLLYYKVPYCKLYDAGFTSLGNALNTSRNPSLLSYDIYLGTDIYLPAYKMLNENKERSGRDILK